MNVHVTIPYLVRPVSYIPSTADDGRLKERECAYHAIWVIGTNH